MKNIALVFTLILMSSIAYAKPIYLECSTKSEKETHNFSVKFDEESGKITHTQEDGYAFNTEGFFAANEVTYQKIDLFDGVRLTRQYKVDRADLSAIHTTTIESVKFPDQVPPTISKESGMCSIVALKKNKI